MHPNTPAYCSFSAWLVVIDVGESDQPIPLPNVSSSVLKKVSFFIASVGGDTVVEETR